MAERPGLSRSTVLLVLVALCLSGLLLAREGCRERQRAARGAASSGSEPALDEPIDAGPTPSTPRPARRAVRTDAAVPGPTPARLCAPRARKDCRDGDVWWFDSCDQPSALAEACEGRRCTGTTCAASAPIPNPCGAITSYGACEGDVARVCLEGRIVDFDCSERRGRCVMTAEGAQCLPHGPLDCEPGAVARCYGDVLRQCIDGSWQELDCALRVARCEIAAGQARCSPVSPGVPGFGGGERAKVEICDQLDNDDDERIDEAGACETVALVPFVEHGSDPLVADPERLVDELAIVNRVFSPIVFTWAERIEVGARTVDGESGRLDRVAVRLAQAETAALARAQADKSSPAPSPAQLRIPVLYVERIRNQPPKAGLSTLPNNSCGGVRISDAAADPRGVIVLSEARQPETLAHELGHYLGLCHTHDDVSRYGQALAPTAACEQTGDAICDTPFDPGSPPCVREPYCDLRCPSGNTPPDAFNIMSYYFGCRRALTAQQMAEVERTLGLRRGWARCIGPQDCPCAPGVLGTCPAGMSCQPGEPGASWSCALDGPALPGAPCRFANQCSLGSFCLADRASLAGRCVRPCAQVELDCECNDVGLPYRICVQDLGR